MSLPTLSVVLACRETAAELPAMLASLRAQEVTGWVDIVIVDDGSEDDTAAVAREHSRDLPGPQVLRTEPTNRATAFNAAVRASTGEVVVFLDGDDEIAPGYLAAFQAALVDHPFVAARIDHLTLNRPWQQTSRPPEQVDGLRTEPRRPWPLAGGGTIGIRRSAFDAVGGYDEAMTYTQDLDLCWRLAAQGVGLTFVPEAVLRYRYRRTARAVFQQARRYGRSGVVLDHRYGSGRSWPRVARRTGRLAALGLRLPLCVTRTGRFATAHRLGHAVGWLEAALAPRRYFSEAELAPRDD